MMAHKKLLARFADLELPFFVYEVYIILVVAGLLALASLLWCAVVALWP